MVLFGVVVAVFLYFCLRAAAKHKQARTHRLHTAGQGAGDALKSPTKARQRGRGRTSEMRRGARPPAWLDADASCHVAGRDIHGMGYVGAEKGRIGLSHYEDAYAGGSLIDIRLPIVRVGTDVPGAGYAILAELFTDFPVQSKLLP